MSEKKLTPQQELFVKEYLIDLNATQAAIRAGYSKKTAQEQGSRLLSNVIIASKVAETLGKRLDKLDISGERILNELARVGFGRMTDVAKWTESGVSFVPSTELNEDQAATVCEVTETTNEHGGSLKIKQHDKLKALELLGKYQKLFTDKVEHSADESLEALISGSMRKAG
jgi:phage terminase small subunit